MSDKLKTCPCNPLQEHWCDSATRAAQIAALEAEVGRLRDAEIARTMQIVETAKLVQPMVDLAKDEG